MNKNKKEKSSVYVTFFKSASRTVSYLYHPQSTQSAGPVRFLIFCSISISLLASLVAGRRPSVQLVQISKECTPSYLSTGISNMLQPAQAEAVLGQRSTYLASWISPPSASPTPTPGWAPPRGPLPPNSRRTKHSVYCSARSLALLK